MNTTTFIETMRVTNGAIDHLPDHIRRMELTCREVFGSCPDLSPLVNAVIPVDAKKCRVVYGRQIEVVEFGDYVPRKIASLKLVTAPSAFDYHLKYADRGCLTELFAMRGDCDDILIVREGMITDTSIANIVFTDGTRYVTPDTCLLPGTTRRRLLMENKIDIAALSPASLAMFTHAIPINAMLPLGSIPPIPIENIR